MIRAVLKAINGKWFFVCFLLAVGLVTPYLIYRFFQNDSTASALTAVPAIDYPDNFKQRFSKALVLTDQDKIAEAISVYESLIVQYPDYPEAYNNLAILYAKTDRLEDARRQLEKALQTSASYSAVHENLAGIYERIASESYRKALHLDAALNTQIVTLKPITDIRSPSTSALVLNQAAVSAKTASQQSTITAKPIQPTDTKNTQTTEINLGSLQPKSHSSVSSVASVDPTQTANPSPKRIPIESLEKQKNTAEKTIVLSSPTIHPYDTNRTEKQKTSSAVNQVQTIKQQDIQNPSPTVPAEKKPAVISTQNSEFSDDPLLAIIQDKTNIAVSSEQTDSASEKQTEVIRFLNRWANAWSKKDTKAYLAAYSRDFKTPNGISRTEWANTRKNRITEKKQIDVQVSNIQIEWLDDHRAKVRFSQRYASGSLKSSTRKMMILKKVGSAWRIEEERIG